MDRSEQSITSRILSIFYHNPNNFISTMLVGNNIALVIYGILMAELIEQQLLADYISNEFMLVLTQTIISTLIILVTGEFMPKTLFKINPNFTLSVFAIPTFICYVVLYPLSKFASGISGILLRLTGTKINKEVATRHLPKWIWTISSKPASKIQLTKKKSTRKSRFSRMHWTSPASRFATVWCHEQKSSPLRTTPPSMN